MFNSMRSGKKKTAMYFVVALLMLGLGGFGIGGLSRGTIRSIGSVGEEKIPINTYARAYRNIVAQMNQRFGRALSPSELQQFGLSQSALESVLRTAAVNNEAAVRGLSVGDEIVRRNILENPRFQGPDGKFDKEAYNYFLERSLNMHASEFDELLRKENARSLIEGSVSGGLATSETVPKAIVGFVRETRDFEWAWVTELQLSEPVAAPTSDQLKTYYEDHSKNYYSLESRNVTYSWLSPDMLVDKVDLSDADIRAAYDSQPDRFNKVERRIVDRIVFPTQAEASAARDALDGQTATFEDIAKQRNLTPDDIKMGEIEASDLSSKAGDLVFGSDGPGVVGPVESSLGPALFRVNAIIAEDITPFDQAAAILRTELAAESASRLVSDRLSQIDDSLAGGATLEQLGEETDMQTATLDFTTESTEPIAKFAAFRQAVLTAKESDFPELVDLADGGIFAVRLNQINPAAPIPFAKVSDQLKADWSAAQTLGKLQDMAASFKTRLESGQSFADLELAPNAQTGVARDQSFPDLPQGAVGEIFKAETGKVVVLEGQDGVFIARLNKITKFDPEDSANQLLIAQLRQSLTSQIGADMFDLYTAALRKEAGVTLNQAALNSVNSQIAAQ